MSTPSNTPPTLDDLHATLRQLLQNQQTLDTHLTNLTHELTPLRSRLPPPGFAHLGVSIDQAQPYRTSEIKLELPRFDGNDALGWIFKINPFFEFHQTLEHQRLRMASFYMEGEILTWF